MNKILSNKYVRYLVALGIGVAIGAVFYPSKSIDREVETKYRRKIEKLQEEKMSLQSSYEEKLRKEFKQNVEVQAELKRKYQSVKTENKKLQQKVSEKTLKIVKPDGTIVEETIKESETEIISKVVTEIREEFNTKVRSIENKWQMIHKDRVTKIKKKYDKKLKEKDETISSLKKKEKVEINKRSFGIAAGVLDDQSYYTNGSYDIFGPVFLNIHFETDRQLDEKRGGIGIGLRF